MRDAQHTYQFGQGYQAVLEDTEEKGILTAILTLDMPSEFGTRLALSALW
jgi:hypothetical protein